MDTEPGRSLILWSVRLSVACYAAALWIWLPRRRRPSGISVDAYPGLWFASWILCVVHVLFAFHFEHRWSHAAALKHTAEMTARVVGWYWSGGLWINFAFMSVWGLHASRQLLKSPMGQRGAFMPSTDVVMHAVAAFMMFNATAVFGPRWWIAVVMIYATMLVLPLWIRRTPNSAADA